MAVKNREKVVGRSSSSSRWWWWWWTEEGGVAWDISLRSTGNDGSLPTISDTQAQVTLRLTATAAQRQQETNKSVTETQRNATRMPSESPSVNEKNFS